jgi:hypothetical protein
MIGDEPFSRAPNGSDMRHSNANHRSFSLAQAFYAWESESQFLSFFSLQAPLGAED